MSEIDYPGRTTNTSIPASGRVWLTSGIRCLAPLLLLAATLQVRAGGPAPILPDSLQWKSPPGNAPVEGAWVVGAENQSGNYLLRVRIAVGGKIAPHTHPDERNTTVLSGTLYVGFGGIFDETSVTAVPAGAVYVAPANTGHFVWAKDGEVIYQEAGRGPTATLFLPP